MKMIPLAFVFAMIHAAHAEIGATEQMAIEKFGNPVGTGRSGERVKHIYQTAYGLITEVYDADGICIESDATQILPQEIITTNAPANDEDLSKQETAKETSGSAGVETNTVIAPAAKKYVLSVNSEALKQNKKDVKSEPNSEEIDSEERQKARAYKYAPHITFALLFVVSVVGLMLGPILKLERQEKEKRERIKDLFDDDEAGHK